MRFLHISDLHIGKRISNVDLYEDQKFVLDQIVDMVTEYDCDAVLIAGDIYDRTQPSERAIGMVDSFLRDLSDTGKHIYMISGNHDNQAQISYLSGILERSKIFVSDRLQDAPQRYTETDEYGDIDIYLLPFVRVSQVNRAFPEADAKNIEEAYSYMIGSYDIDAGRRNVIVSHQFIRGASKGGSEEMSIGGLEEISSSVLDPFDYAALGHIHAPQKVGRDGIQYPGSLLKYHFDETDQVKGALIVDLKEKGEVSVRKVPFKTLHDMRRLTGKLSEIMAMGPSDDYIEAVLTDEGLLLDAGGSLRTVFPNLLSVRRESREYSQEIEELQDIKEDDLEEHFRNFYSMQHDGREPSEKQMQMIRDALSGLEDDDETDIS